MHESLAVNTDHAGTFLCCGTRVDALSPEDARRSLLASCFGSPRSVHLCNAFTLALAQRQPEYRELLNGGDLNLADGQPVAFVGRRLGHSQLVTSVRGPSLLADVLDAGQRVGLKHYFYGSTPEVCQLLRKQVHAKYPAAEVVGVESPPFRPLTDREELELVDRVRTGQPDIVWVGLGTPKQDHFVEEFRERLGTTLVAIGAGFDFLAGTKRAAPEWMQNAGLEWLFRLGSEPRRLWRRYLVGNVIFIRGASGDVFAARTQARR